MAPISNNRPVSAPIQTQSTQATGTTRAAASAETERSAIGHTTRDSFTPAPSTTPKPIPNALEQLARFPPSADRAAVEKLLNTPWTTDSEMTAAQDALKRLAENAPEGMTGPEFDKIQSGIIFKANQNTMMGMVIGSMQKMIDEARARGEKKD